MCVNVKIVTVYGDVEIVTVCINVEIVMCVLM